MRHSPAPGAVIRLVAFLLALCLAPRAFSQPLAAGAYLAQLQAGVHSGLYHSLAIGWIDGSLTGPGQRQAWYLGRDHKPDGQSQFELGAVTEVFSGLLLARAAMDGKIRLAATLGEVLPEEVVFADAGLSKLTVRELALHQTALPSVPKNLFPERMSDPYAGFDGAALLAFIANFQTDAAARSDGYSVLDYGLLAWALAHAYGARYPVALVDQVLDPLDMQHTGFGDTAQLLDGWSHGVPASHWHFGALSGAAGLRSSLPDMLQFLQTCLTPEHSPLRGALLLTRQPQESGDAQRGFGWNVTRADGDGDSWPIIWRSSRTGGFSAFVGFRSDRQQALVLLGNTDADLGGIGMAWLDGRSPPALAAAAPGADATVDPSDFTGLYRTDAGLEVRVLGTQGHLYAQLPGSFPVRLQGRGEDVFAAADDSVMLSFQREGKRVASALVGLAGSNTLAVRISVRAPALARTAQDVAPAKLVDYVGDYRIDRHSLVRIAISGESLSAQPTGQRRLTLVAYAPDRFSSEDGCCEVAFQRGENQHVARMVLVLAGVERRAERISLATPRPLWHPAGALRMLQQ